MVTEASAGREQQALIGSGHPQTSRRWTSDGIRFFTKQPLAAAVGRFVGPRCARSRYTRAQSNDFVSEVYMARITVEDCLHNIPNLFQLVLVAAKRARKLANGAEPTVEWENDKPTVVALREIAAGHIGPEILEEVERPAPEALPEMEMQPMSGEIRAPHLGLGDQH